MNNRRGEAWVVIQIVLLAAILFAPGGSFGGMGALARIGGLLLGLVGVVFVGVSALHLGGNLTVFPRPKDDGTLTQTGIYGLVRHPMYSGVILGSLGYALLRESLPGLVLVAALLVFFDRKAAQEERWLAGKFPDYVHYRQRVKKLIPFIY